MKKSWIYILIFLWSGTLQSQIVNKGLAYISPDTEVTMLYDFKNKENAEFYQDGKTYFYKNFTNQGIFDFYEDTGTSWFVGNNLQKLQGSEPSYFQNLVFENFAQMTPFELHGTFQVENSARFLRGIIDNRNHGGRMIFGNSAQALQTSDLSFVDGSVEKMGEANFIYPIGNEGFYRFAGTSNAALPNHYEAIYFYANSDSQFPHQQRQQSILDINNREYWKIDRQEGEGEQIFVSLSYHNVATPQDFIVAAAQGALVIVRWDEEEQKWINEEGTIHLNDKSIIASVEKMGVFTLGKIEAEDRDEDCEVEVYNLIDLKGNSNNKFLRFESDCAENYSVEVYNRWGVKVFESNEYGVSGEVFDGYSTGRMTIGKSDHLPTGTYFYIVNYFDSVHSKMKREVGYLYIQG